MYSLQEAFIHPPEQCEAHFNMDAHALFDVFWTIEQKHAPTEMIQLGIARTIFLYNPDWILKEESHIHLGCLEGE